VKGQISNQNETVHVEFTGQESWEYDLKKVNQNKKHFFQLTVPTLDDSTAAKLEGFKSPFVKSLKIQNVDGEKKSQILFELADENVESFDYLTDQPSRLIVDFFTSAKATKKTAEAKKEKSAAPAKASAKAEAKVAADKRKPAGDVLIIKDGPGEYNVANSKDDGLHAGIFDGGDPAFDRFTIKDYEIKEEAILKSKDNYYIPFPMLELDNLNWERVKVANPEYSINAADTEENKEARLLLTLFKKKRYNVYLKALEWFEQKYPDSKYQEIITFMTGDVYFKNWQATGNVADFDIAIEKYKEGLKKFPTSVLAERTSVMLGYLQLERGDNLSAIKYLNEHATNTNFGGPHVFSKDLARLGVYLGYIRLNKFNEAYQTLETLEKESPHTDLKMEAAYRKGDIFVKSKNFTRAVEEYQRALAAYPQGQTTMPNAYFNQAESLFLLDKYRQSLDTFREYGHRFPSSDHAPFALTRIGELLEILGADKARVMGAYLETYFRYGESPSAIIARLRLLSARMKGMKQKEVDVTVKEILSLSQKLNLPNIQEFATVMIADGYNQRKDYDKALDLLVKYFQEHHGTVDEAQLRKRIVSNINDKFREQVEAGDFISGLKTHQKYADNWLKGTDNRLDTKYFIGRAFENGGANQQAEKFYQDVVNEYYAAQNTEKQKNILVLEHLPSLDSLNLRLASVLVSEGRYSRAYDQLKNIKHPEQMSEEEQIERVSLAVKLLDKKGDVDSAIRYLTELLKVWKGVPSLLAEPYLNLADLEVRAGRSEDAKKSLEKVDRMMKDSGKVSESVHSAALEKLSDLYFQDKQIDKSIATYKELLDLYESKKPLSSIRYKLGKIYFDRGDIQKAADIWGQFKNDKSGMWEKLAQEELKNVEWQTDYKKYLKRIPAMAGKAQ
jgi:tetratricopeptide (TPR) repeat protein